MAYNQQQHHQQLQQSNKSSQSVNVTPTRRQYKATSTAPSSIDINDINMDATDSPSISPIASAHEHATTNIATTSPSAALSSTAIGTTSHNQYGSSHANTTATHAAQPMVSSSSNAKQLTSSMPSHGTHANLLSPSASVTSASFPSEDNSSKASMIPSSTTTLLPSSSNRASHPSHLPFLGLPRASNNTNNSNGSSTGNQTRSSLLEGIGMESSPMVPSPPYTLRTSPVTPTVPIQYPSTSHHNISSHRHRRSSSATMAGDDDDEDDNNDQFVVDNNEHSPLAEDTLTTAGSSYNSTTAESPYMTAMRPSLAPSPLPTSYVPSAPLPVMLPRDRRDSAASQSSLSGATLLGTRALRSGSNGDSSLGSSSPPLAGTAGSGTSPSTVAMGSPLLQRRRLARRSTGGSLIMTPPQVHTINNPPPGSTNGSQAPIGALLASALAQGLGPSQSPMSTTSEAASPGPLGSTNVLGSLSSTMDLLTPAHAPTPTPSPAPPRSPKGISSSGSFLSVSRSATTDTLDLSMITSPYPPNSARRFSVSDTIPAMPPTPQPESPRTPSLENSAHALLSHLPSATHPDRHMLMCQISRGASGNNGAAPTPLPSPRTPALDNGSSYNNLIGSGLLTAPSTPVEPVTPLQPKTPPCTPNDLQSPLPYGHGPLTPRGMSTTSMPKSLSSQYLSLVPRQTPSTISNTSGNTNQQHGHGIGGPALDRLRDQLNRLVGSASGNLRQMSTLYATVNAPSGTQTPGSGTFLSPTMVSRAEWLSSGRAVTPSTSQQSLNSLMYAPPTPTQAYITSPPSSSASVSSLPAWSSVSTGNGSSSSFTTITVTAPPTMITSAGGGSGSKDPSPAATPTQSSSLTSGTSIPTATPTPTTSSAGNSPRRFLWNVSPQAPTH
jgi:hypothetical protein